MNLLANLPTSAPAEIVTDLLTHDNVRIERIVSTGQITPEGEWVSGVSEKVQWTFSAANGQSPGRIRTKANGSSCWPAPRGF